MPSVSHIFSIATSQITDHGNEYSNKKFWNLVKTTIMWPRHNMSKYYWKNGVNRLAWSEVATKLQFGKKLMICEVQQSKKPNKTKYIYKITYEIGEGLIKDTFC